MSRVVLPWPIFFGAIRRSIPLIEFGARDSNLVRQNGYTACALVPDRDQPEIIHGKPWYQLVDLSVGTNGAEQPNVRQLAYLFGQAID